MSNERKVEVMKPRKRSELEEKPTVVNGKHTLNHVNYKEFLELFSEEARPRMAKLFDKPDTKAVVVFENDNEDSPKHLSKTAVRIGPNSKIKSIQECVGKFIGDWMNNEAEVAKYYVVK